MAPFTRLCLALAFAGCIGLPARAGDVAGWIDDEVNAALAAAGHSALASCAEVDTAAAIDCEVNIALATVRSPVLLAGADDRPAEPDQAVVVR